MARATLAQGIEVLKMIERGDYDREMVQAIIDKRIVIKSVEGEGLERHHYRIMVTSTALPTYADLIANYGEGNVCEFWDESKHRLELHESLREFTPPTGEVTVFVKKFDRPTTSEKAIKWADEHGYRFVFPWEREAFSNANPDFQRKFWIVDLGSFTLIGGGGRCVPDLIGHDGRRCLGNSMFDYEWYASYHFLFASK
jgi:hypothetical protein